MWYLIPGWSYEVSDELEVRNRRTGKVLLISSNGYFSLHLPNGEQRSFRPEHLLAFSRDGVPFPHRNRVEEKPEAPTPLPVDPRIKDLKQSRRRTRTITYKQHLVELMAKKAKADGTIPVLPVIRKRKRD